MELIWPISATTNDNSSRRQFGDGIRGGSGGGEGRGELDSSLSCFPSFPLLEWVPDKKESRNWVAPHTGTFFISVKMKAQFSAWQENESLTLLEKANSWIF